ncbi:MAG: PQQ-binding-like beta-propeller repeat protein, partial [Lentisphaerae bacterium]|nr:PQQ-binding-like beta-propeller repeat protein [Lentisphaerota bacterium]
PATASTNIVAGTAQTNRTIHWDGDEDYVKFTVQAYHRYACLVTNVSPTYRPWIALYNGEGTTSMAAFYATQVGSYSAAAPGGNAFLTNTVFADGNRYLRVFAVQGTGVYTVLVTDLGATAAADPYEADNTPAAASAMAADTVRTNYSIHLTNDADWISFTAQAERYYRVNTESLGEGLDTVLYLYDGTGTSLLASNNNYGGLASTIEYKFTNAGTYYAKVEAAGGASVGPYSLRLTDMRLRTKWTLNHGIYSSPAVADDGTIYVGTWMGNRLYALNLDGRTNRIWNLPAGVNASPAIHTNGGVYMGVSVGGGTQFYSFNTNGTTNWAMNLFSRIYATAAIGYDGTLYVGQEAAGVFFSLSPDGLATNWTRNTGAMFNNVCSPVIATNGAILVGVPGAGYLYSYNPNGTTNWICDFLGLLNAPLAIDSNGMALAATSDGKLYRIDASNGTTNFIWQAEGSGNMSGPVIATDGTIYRTTSIGSTGRLYSLRADGGTNWVDLFADQIQSTPAIGRDGTIYFGCNNSKFYAVNPDGTTNFVWQLNDDASCSPVIDTNGMVYVGTANWALYAMYGTGYGQSGGLAEDCWPMFQHDAKHTGARHPPASPGMTASDGAYTDKIRLAWQAATNATGYQVWRSLTSSSSNAVFVAQTASTNYDDASVPAGASYYYWIKSKAHSGVSGFSLPDTGWRAMASPSGLSAGDGTFTDRVAVTWGSVTGASSYRVWRNTTGETNGASLLATATNAAFSDTSAVPGTLYYFWAQASNAFEMTAFGSTDTGWRALSPPGAVSAGDGTFADKVSVSWGAVTGAAGYVVFRGSLDATGTAVELAATTALAVDDTSAAAGATNFYWVKATNALGISGFSASDSGYRLAPPGAPTGVSASDGLYAGRVMVSWTALSGATGYEIWRSTSNDSGSASRIGTTAGTSYEDTTASAGVPYFYWVKATNAAGASGFSASDSGYAMPLPGTPTGVSASDGAYSDRIHVVWSAVSNASGYEVWRHTANDTTAAGKLADTAETVFDDTTAMVGPIYFYWVKATNASGASGFSDPDSGYAGTSGGTVGGGTAVNDYDGDGVSDLTVFDNAGAGWYARSMAGSNIAWAVPWGWPGALPVPGDYDGDGRSDLAVFDGNSGAWYVQSVSGTTIAWAVQWGWLGALPVPGDYDGDGAGDYPVFDQDTGNWYIRSASGSTIAWAVLWGWPGALPVPGDYDGDGVGDLAVYDAASGRWFVESVSGTLIAWSVEWGGATFDPVPGDFDGDGRSDLAVFDRSTGLWFIRSMTGTTLAWAWAWGWPGASALAGDYDGNGVSDAALYDSNAGTWYIGTLTNTVLGWQVLWGGSGFVPVGE